MAFPMEMDRFPGRAWVISHKTVAVAAQLDLPRSTVYHLLAALQEHGFVMHLPEERRFGLGLAAFELSSAYTRQEPLARIGRPLIVALVDQLGFSGHLAVQHGRDVLYIIEERAKVVEEGVGYAVFVC